MRIRYLVAQAIAVVLTLSTAVPTRANNEANVAALDRFIIPAYQAMVEQAEHMDAATRAFCTGSGSLEDLKGQFQLLMDSIQAARLVPMGRIHDNEPWVEIYFWPDSRGAAHRQLGKMLAQADHEVLEESAFTHLSIAVRGVGAAGDLLLDPAISAQDFWTEAGPTYRCELLRAITASILRESGELAAVWVEEPDNWRRRIAQADPDDPLFAEDELFSGDILFGLRVLMESILLQLETGRLVADREPVPGATAWMNDWSLRDVSAGLDAARELFDLSLAPQLRSNRAGQRYAPLVNGLLEQAAGQSAALSEALRSGDSEQISIQTEALKTSVTQLLTLFINRLHIVLGFASDFRFGDADGD